MREENIKDFQANGDSDLPLVLSWGSPGGYLFDQLDPE